MRIKVSFLFKNSPVVLPFNYQYHLASLIYRAVQRGDKDLSFELHKKKGYKFFTFSWLLAREREVTPAGIRLKSTRAHFFVSSPDKRFILAVLNGLLSKPEVGIGKVSAVVEHVEIVEEPKFNGKWVIFNTISPIVVRTGRLVNGRLKHRDLFPTEKKFYENLIQNLRKKYESYFGNPANGEVEVKVLRFEPKRIKIKNNWHRCSLMHFAARGDGKLLEFAYQAGWGEKNSMGFGMVRVI